MAEELNNPLFDNEREFLERKKLEYERALRGDVDHLKDQSVQVGKVALVGVGLAGGIWLISKLFGGKSKSPNKGKKDKSRKAKDKDSRLNNDIYDDTDDDFDLDAEAFALDRSAEMSGDTEFGSSSYAAPAGEAYGTKSARDSARVFQEGGGRPYDAYYDEAAHPEQSQSEDIENQSFNNSVGSHSHQADRPVRTTNADLPHGRLDFGPTVPLHKQALQPTPAPQLPYDDSRRLPKSSDFSAEVDGRNDFRVSNPNAGPRLIISLGQQAGSALKAFLETPTGKAVAAQVAAVVLAYVTKKVNDLMPAATTSKNADLVPPLATTSFYPVTPQPANLNPAASLIHTDAPTEHPAS